MGTLFKKLGNSPPIRLVKKPFKFLYLLYRSRQDPKGVCFFLYHDIGDYAVPGAVTETTFRQHMRFIKRFAEILPLDEALEFITGQTPLDKNYAVITFDDALVNFKTNALPIIEQENIPVTVYVPTGYIGKEMPSLSHGVTYPILNAEDLQELAKHPLVTFGSHSVTHQRMPDIQDPEQLRHEVQDSKTALEELLSSTIEHFSYPKGNYNEQIIQQLKACHYTSAVTCESGKNYPNQDVFALRRCWINKQTTLLKIYFYLNNPY